MDYLSLSSLDIDLEVWFSVNAGIDSPGLCYSAIKFADALPKTTKSKRELAPNLLAPCTLGDPTSPHAQSPDTISLSS